MGLLKRTFLPIILLSVFCLVSCYSNPKKHKEVMETYIEGHKLINIREGDFTPGKTVKYLAFYSKNDGIDRDDIDKILYFQFKKNKIEKVIVIPDLWSIGGYKDFSKEISASNYTDSEWDGYCFTADYNKNGIDEFVFFTLTGRSFFVNIYEYNGEEKNFVRLLPPKAFDGLFNVFKINTIQEDGKDYVMLYGYGRNLPEGHLKWNKCEWSEGKGQYILIDHGSEYFEF